MQHLNWKNLLVCLISTYCFQLQAQDETFQHPSTTTVTPPSPTASALGRYAEVPVNLHSGIPEISIPLYTITQGDLTIPVKLSFHAGGHKVQSVAGLTGLGWSLIAGGVVTRSVRGLEDEAPYGYENVISTFVDWKNQDKLWYLGQGYNPETSPNNPALPGFIDVKSVQYDIKQFGKDAESDLYFFNYPGGTGKFRVNYDNSIVQLPYGDRKINFGGYGSGFDIFDPNGNKYTFDRLEESSSLDEGINSQEHPTAWFMSSARSGGGEVINFSYVGHTETRVLRGNQFFHYDLRDGTVETVFGSSKTSHSNTKHLDRISWRSGYAQFHYSDDRQDMPSGYGKKLDRVEIFNLNAELLTSWNLKYEYFSANGGQNYGDKHLKLVEVQEISSTGKAKPPYRFEYVEEVPSQTSYAMDHYGFYNGATTNTHLVPSFYTNWQKEFTGADRSPNTSKVKAGALTKMIYPTGGYTAFSYESNSFMGTPQMVGVEYDESIQTQGLVATAWNCSNDDPSNNPEGIECLEGTGSYAITEEQQIPSDAYDLVFSIRKLVPYSACGESTAIAIENNDDLHIRLLVKQPDNSFEEVLRLTHADFGTLEGCIAQTDPDYPLWILGVSLLNPGDIYKLEAVANIENTMIGGSVHYKSVIQSSTYKDVSCCDGGGIRVQNISHYDGSSAFVSESIEYEYTLEETGESSGVPLFEGGDEPIIKKEVKIVQTEGGGGIPIPDVYDRAYHFADPVGYLGTYAEAPVVYSEVLVKKTNKGSERHFFSTERNGYTKESGPIEEDSGIGNVNLNIRESFFWKRGSLLGTKYYDDGGTKVKEVINNYEYIELPDSVTSFVYKVVRDFTNVAGGSNLDVVFAYGFEKQHSGWARLKSSQNIEYFEAGDITTQTDYFYDPSDLLIPPTLIEYLVGPDSYKVEYDFLRESGLDYHFVNLPKTITRKKLTSELLNKTEYIYAGSTTRNPVSIISYDASNSVIGSTELRSYNFSRPSEILDQSGIYTSVIWDTGGNYPLFIAKGASLAKLQTAYTELGSNLRAHANLQKAHLTSYQFKPLVGPTQITDPNGETLNYIYDDFGRLEVTTDDEGNLLNKTEYHYSHENQQ